MATAEWLEEHPKVIAYLSTDLHAQLKEYQSALKLSMSKTIEQLLGSALDLLLPKALVAPADHPSCSDGSAADRAQRLPPPGDPAAQEAIQGEHSTKNGSFSRELASSNVLASLQAESTHERGTLQAVVEPVASLQAQLHSVTTQLGDLVNVSRVLMDQVADLEAQNSSFLAALNPSIREELENDIELKKTISRRMTAQSDMDQSLPDLFVNSLPPRHCQKFEAASSDLPQLDLWLTTRKPEELDCLSSPPMNRGMQPAFFQSISARLPASPESRGLLSSAQPEQPNRADAAFVKAGSGLSQFFEESNTANPPALPFAEEAVANEPSRSVTKPVRPERSQPVHRPESERRTGQTGREQPPRTRSTASSSADAQPSKKEKKQPDWLSKRFWF